MQELPEHLPSHVRVLSLSAYELSIGLRSSETCGAFTSDKSN